MPLKVEFKPHHGLLQNGRAISHNQTLVFVEGKQVAIYCANMPETGGYLSFINVVYEVAQEKNIPAADVMKAVIDGLKERKVEPSKYDYPPPPFGEPLDGLFSSQEIIVSSEGVSAEIHM